MDNEDSTTLVCTPAQRRKRLCIGYSAMREIDTFHVAIPMCVSILLLAALVAGSEQPPPPAAEQILPVTPLFKR